MDGIDEAGVGAAEEDYETAWGLEIEGLVIVDWVNDTAGGIEEELAAGVFEVVESWNGAGGKETGEDFGGMGDKGDTGGKAEVLGDVGGHANFAERAILFAAETRGEGGGMEEDGCDGGSGQEMGEAGGMVVMAVGEDDGVCGGEVDAEGRGVVGGMVVWAGVEQEVVCWGLDPDGEAVLVEEVGQAG